MENIAAHESHGESVTTTNYSCGAETGHISTYVKIHIDKQVDFRLFIWMDIHNFA
jgi:hypothetical protein